MYALYGVPMYILYSVPMYILYSVPMYALYSVPMYALYGVPMYTVHSAHCTVYVKIPVTCLVFYVYIGYILQIFSKNYKNSILN